MGQDEQGIAAAAVEAEARAAFEATFAIERKISFARFRDEFFPQVSLPAAISLSNGGGEVDALTVWTQIRSFLVGSVEAILHKERTDTASDLSLDAFLSPEVFSYGRCRIDDGAKRVIYHVYVKYREHLGATGMWDDTDLIMDVALKLRRHYGYHALPPEQLGHVGSLDAHAQPLYDRIYIDEVQVRMRADYKDGPGLRSVSHWVGFICPLRVLFKRTPRISFRGSS
jgi:hypothetical protein